MHSTQHTPNDIYIQGDTAYMVLTNSAGQPIAVTQFDAADVPLVRAHPYRWHASWHQGQGCYYVASRLTKERNGGGKVLLHRYLLRPLPTMFVDHKNHNTLDNRRTNLRNCTPQENSYNLRPQFRAGSPLLYRGRAKRERVKRPVAHRYVWQSPNGRWRGYVLADGKRHHFSGYATKEDALAAAERLQREMAA